MHASSRRVAAQTLRSQARSTLSAPHIRNFSHAAGSAEAAAPPIVAIPCCYHSDPGGNHFQSLHAVTDKYARAAAVSSNVIPVGVPALGTEMPGDWHHILERVDGLLLTGSPSNIHPGIYDPDTKPLPPFDLNRDSTTLPLIRAARDLDIPLLAICRGLQEVNVALGGTLKHDVTEGYPEEKDLYHGYPTDLVTLGPGEREDQHLKYGPAHTVEVTGDLAKIFECNEMMINTCHYQAIDKLGEGLVVEAVAPDGIIEAVRLEGNTFAIAVQWHPEYLQWPCEDRATPRFDDFVQNSEKLFKAFGEACRVQKSKRS
mmetsp:Transcript_10490/g.20829  ORF Transcript_10490/g.20829 Transcript_10490/m.20829 type:complete len:315 (-) Transcript_10490:171-1115(-)